MLSGRLPIRSGATTILGCFVLLGAPVIAQAFLGTWDGTRSREITVEPIEMTAIDTLSERAELPPAHYDPYAGASLRND